MLKTWMQFFICAGIIVLAGTRLTKSVTVAAENSALSLTYRAKKEIARIGNDSLLVLAGYIAVVYLLFKSGGN